MTCEFQSHLQGASAPGLSAGFSLNCHFQWPANPPAFSRWLFSLGQFQGRARESVQAILAGTGLTSRQLAIETVEFPLDMTLALAEELDLSLCLDIGHVLAGFSGPVDLFDALERCLPRLAEIHLHDCPWVGRDGQVVYGQDHQALGKGDLDVGRLLDRLAEAGFAGPLIFELTIQEALASLEMIRGLRPEALA